MKRTILGTIGTPLVRVTSPPGTVIGAKLEAFNPGKSAKDRPALAMIEAAEAAEDLDPGDEIVEATSGNTGIGLAIVCAVKGYKLRIVMPSSKSVERRRLLRAYGASIELVDGQMDDARKRADEIAATGAIQLDQFGNEANAESHYRGTAEELLDQVGDRSIDAFVATVGTGGTLTGIGRRLREEFSDLTIVAVEPEENAVLSTGQPGSDGFQGMGPGFVSDLLDVNLIDQIETVNLPAAEAECRRLAREEGILAGQSSGAALIAARRVAERIAEADSGPKRATDNSTAGGRGEASIPTDVPLVVTVFPDSGERYLSAGTFDDPAA